VVVLVYSALAIMSAFCVFDHAVGSGRHEHHGSQGSPAHNPLCAWACQVTSNAAVATESPASSIGPVVQLVVQVPTQFASAGFFSLLHSRAPPSLPFILLGQGIQGGHPSS
jgi:hypothetical protein